MRTDGGAAARLSASSPSHIYLLGLFRLVCPTVNSQQKAFKPFKLAGGSNTSNHGWSSFGQFPVHTSLVCSEHVTNETSYNDAGLQTLIIKKVK